jgi:lipopolysaccharide export system permease protein
MFVLLMQFLWKYIDDLVGKGLDWITIGQLIFFTSATLVPLALPLAILVSSIMTFGNMAEHFEIVAAKSAGVSLQKLMRPLFIVAALVSGLAFYFSNYVLPVANLKMGSLLYDVRQQKPALYIREGVFYNGIDGYSIRVGRKSPDGKKIFNVMIYDHTRGNGNSKVILADSGIMASTEDQKYLLVTLFSGNSYEEGGRQRGNIDTHPLTRVTFKSQLIRFDLSTFQLSRTNEDLFKDNWQMLNFRQLTSAIDSLNKIFVQRKKMMAGDSKLYFTMLRDSDALKNISPTVEPENPEISKGKTSVNSVMEIALSAARNLKTYFDNNADEIESKRNNITRFSIEWHRKFTLSIACFVLFLIGAPLGAIIRKGGLGMPIVVSIIFFLIFHITSITGEKFAKEGVIPPNEGMWIAPLILLPVGIFLTYKATKDSALLDIDGYLNFFKKLKKNKTV